jgi:hypothetical protein
MFSDVSITGSLAYNLLKDFSLPLLAIIWAIYSYFRQSRRKLSIRQVGDQYSDRIVTMVDGSLTYYSVEVAITNDSPQATIVIAYYDIELPWNEPNLDPLPDPEDMDKPVEFYKFPTEFSLHTNMYVELHRRKVLNHQRFQRGRLAPGDAFRGSFLAKGEMPIPTDFRTGVKEGADRFIEAKIVVQDTTGREYKAPIYLFY